MDVDRVSCAAGAVKGVADRHGMEFKSYDMLSFYEKLKELGAPEDLLELFKDSNFGALTLTDGGTSIKLRLYIDRERRRMSRRAVLETYTIKQHKVASSIAESLPNAVADIEKMQKILSIMKEVLDTVKSCIQHSHF